MQYFDIIILSYFIIFAIILPEIIIYLDDYLEKQLYGSII